jgi:hypothetical protein
MKNEKTKKRKYVSFSELKTWGDCSWRHYLQYVLGIREYGDTVFTDYGTIIHDAGEKYIRTRAMDVDVAETKLREVWVERNYPHPSTVAVTHPEWPSYADPDIEYWVGNLRAILELIPAWLEDNFPGWEFVEAEAELLEEMEGTPLKFRGYIDAIIRVKGKGDKWIYWILDWKTSSKRGWDRQKKSDIFVRSQIILYKHFWTTKAKIPVKDTRCGYVLLRRDVKRNKIQLVDISAGPKTIEKSLKWLRSMMKMVASGRKIKNRYSCMFCEFEGTEHCKMNL